MSVTSSDSFWKIRLPVAFETRCLVFFASQGAVFSSFILSTQLLLKQLPKTE